MAKPAIAHKPQSGSMPKNKGGYRNHRLAQIHILKKELGLDDGTYRDIMLKVVGKSSAGDLSPHALNDFIRHLKSIQTSTRPQEIQYGHEQYDRVLAPQEALVWSLWQQLADLGEVNNRSMAGLMGYIKNRIAKVDDMLWLNQAQLDLLIEQLKNWLNR